jgi:hypothetical protein
MARPSSMRRRFQAKASRQFLIVPDGTTENHLGRLWLFFTPFPFLQVFFSMVSHENFLLRYGYHLQLSGHFLTTQPFPFRFPID